MTRHPQHDHHAIIDEMRRLARSRFETPKELRTLHKRAAERRVSEQHQIVSAIAEHAHIDLKPILEKAREGREQERRHAAETIARLEADATRKAHDEQKRFHAIRMAYQKDFEGHIGGLFGNTRLKFRDVIFQDGDGIAPGCSYGMPSFNWFQPWLGPDTVAKADIAVSTDTPGMWLHPFIRVRTESCEDVPEGQTFQDLTYRMDAPATSFGVHSVRVDLIANGVLSAQLGDTGWTSSPDPLYDHTHVTLDVYIAQETGGEWGVWPLLTTELFAGHGETVQQIRSVLSGSIYPVNFFIRGANSGGGPLLCMVQVACSARAIGSHAYVKLDLGASSGHGIFVGGVALIGAPA